MLYTCVQIITDASKEDSSCRGSEGSLVDYEVLHAASVDVVW